MKKGVMNLFFGIINKFIFVLLGMLLPRIIIENLGSSTNGFISTINQVYGYVSILEAGIGFATVQALYSPLAKQNRRGINGILSATNIYYKKIGCIYLCIIIFLSFIFPYISQSPLSVINTRLLVLSIGCTSAISYFTYGKLLQLLEADGKVYVIHNISSFVTLVNYLLKIILILKGVNIAQVFLYTMCTQLIMVVFFYMYQRKNYSWVSFSATPDTASINKKKYVFIHRICYFIFANTDIILISVFLNYSLASVYATYSLIISTFNSIITLIWSSTVYYWGKMYNREIEKFKHYNLLFQKLFFMITWCSNSIMLCLFIPFIRLYTKGISDQKYEDGLLLLLFLVIYILQGIKTPSISAVEIAGHFKETQLHAVIEIVINIVCTLFFVQWLGIYGVLIGTIIALLYRVPTIIQYASKNIFRIKSRYVYLNIILNLFLFIAVFMICEATFKLDVLTWYEWIKLGFKVSLSALCLFFIGNFIVYHSSFIEMYGLLKRYLHARRK